MFNARSRLAPPPSRTTEQHVLIKQCLWIHLPHDRQRQVIQAVSRVLAQALHSPNRQEARHEPH